MDHDAISQVILDCIRDETDLSPTDAIATLHHCAYSIIHHLYGEETSTKYLFMIREFLFGKTKVH